MYYAKWPKNIPNDHKIHVTKFSIQRPSNIDPNWDFWFENKPSGNPGFESDLKTKRKKMYGVVLITLEKLLKISGSFFRRKIKKKTFDFFHGRLPKCLVY
jgi:hypothetical protein